MNASPTSTSIFERIHVDDRADAGARVAAAGGERRNDLARLRGLGDHHPGKRRAHDGVVDVLFGDAKLALRHLRVLLRSGELCAQGVALRDRLVVLRRRHELFLHQLIHAYGICLGFVELRPHAADLASGRCYLRGGEGALRIGIDGIEPGHDVAGRNLLAFLDHHLQHLAGDLRRHRRHAPRYDITRSVEHGSVAASTADRYDLRRLHLYGIVAAEQRPGPDRDRDREHGRADAEREPEAAAR